MATSQLQDCKYKIIPSIISCLFCSIMNYSLIPMFIKLTTRTHRHPEHTHSYIIYVFINTHIWHINTSYEVQAAFNPVPVWPGTKDQTESLEQTNCTLSSAPLLPSILSGETNTFILTSFVQPIPPMERQTKDFYLQFETGEERRGDCVLIGGTKVPGEPRRLAPFLRSWYSPTFWN